MTPELTLQVAAALVGDPAHQLLHNRVTTSVASSTGRLAIGDVSLPGDSDEPRSLHDVVLSDARLAGFQVDDRDEHDAARILSLACSLLNAKVLFSKDRSLPLVPQVRWSGTAAPSRGSTVAPGVTRHTATAGASVSARGFARETVTLVEPEVIDTAERIVRLGLHGSGRATSVAHANRLGALSAYEDATRAPGGLSMYVHLFRSLEKAVDLTGAIQMGQLGGHIDALGVQVTDSQGQALKGDHVLAFNNRVKHAIRSAQDMATFARGEREFRSFANGLKQYADRAIIRIL